MLAALFLIAICLPVYCQATTKHDKDERNVRLNAKENLQTSL
jgi:hypothetical protein